MRNLKRNHMYVEYFTKNGIEIKIQLPCKKEVCGRCDGKGRHSDPNIDGNGITSEEWDRDWDDDSREAYMRGDYDVVCEECNGNNVVDVVDEPRLTKRQKLYYELYCEQKKQHDMWDREDRMTRFHESGGRYD